MCIMIVYDARMIEFVSKKERHAAVLLMRSHHVLCTLGFQGKGYSAAFVANFAALKQGLERRTLVRITDQTDAICGPCPHRRGVLCASEQKVQELDRRHCCALGIRPHQVYAWGELLERVQKYVRPGDLSNLCKGCAWQPLGVCKAAVQQLVAQSADQHVPKVCDTVHSLSQAKN